MAESRELASNVFEFLERAAALHGRRCEEEFSQDMYGHLSNGACESPIEDLFFIAVHAMCAAERFEVNPHPRSGPDGVLRLQSGVYVETQALVGKYRVDFLLRQVGIGPEDIVTPVVVELDGHAFHDKNKFQRAYEKARDRFLVKKGLKVLHFTGSEVCADPFKVAFEALDLLAVFCGVREEYNPEDPLGFGG
ncbi:endonuclease domain-containing protein [Achromobacter xylosoxidans]|uniref:endonuclease domain-containing protein n=1 Tax=Alcaligenes xylosoxydans xylosoxydans TaxID=85698 RepID=UPI001F148B6F|nr:DUF559 domain-containing protein [Achromobacter xylosoxidans]